ncbi:MAG TPA: hypothetical protein VN442_06365 [Bryobacteraceae bacterium]|nr:hypothetical protein [Bryobacteraceae bacterium]
MTDEACHGFLSVYNPTVLAIRQSLPWLPLPVFRFETWLAGLAIALVALSVLSAFAFRRAAWTRVAAYALAIMMAANALGHAAATFWMARPMPGVYSSPLLMAASLWLLVRARA